MQSILVPVSVQTAVLKRLGRLAKKAGMSFDVVSGTTIQYRKVRTRHVRVRGHSHVTSEWYTLELDTNAVLPCARVTLSDMPRFAGHEFIGKVSHIRLHDGTTGNTLCLAPGARDSEVPAEWRTGAPKCDHCNTRRDRKDTFLIRKPDGTIVRIGRNCLADFLMCDPAQMVGLAEFQDSLAELSSADPDGDGDFWGCGRCSFSVAPFWFLCCAVSCVDAHGFVKRDDPSDRKRTSALAEEISRPFVKGTCRTAYDERIEAERLAEWTALQPSLDQQGTAVAILLWLEGNTDTSDYIHNLKVAAQAAIGETRTLGLLASAPTAWLRATGNLAPKAAKPSTIDAGYLGTIGTRIKVAIPVTVESVRHAPSTVTIINARSADGHAIVVFSDAGDAPRESEVAIGGTWLVKGTPKAHKDYKGTKQTTLTRCAWTPPAEVAASRNQPKAAE